MLRKLCLSVLILALASGFVQAQSPAPSSAEQELQQPLKLDDGKPTLPTSAPAEPSAWRAIGSTMLVLGLMGGALWALRRYGVKKIPGAGGGRLKIEESLALGEKRYVSILSADDEKFLIALSPRGISLLARMDTPEALPQEPFEAVLDHQVEILHPTSVKELEAQLKAARP